MKVFFDTNVLVSAFATRGLCADVLRVVLAEHEFMTGEVVLGELKKALTNKLKVPVKETGDILEFLNQQEITPKPDEPLKVPTLDLDDALVLASAINAGAEILLTGDEDFLTLEKRKDIQILSPRSFWELLKK